MSLKFTVREGSLSNGGDSNIDGGVSSIEFMNIETNIDRSSMIDCLRLRRHF